MMGSEQVREVRVRRHVFDTERPVSEVLDGIYGGISRPDIGALLGQLAACRTYEEFTALVRAAQGSAGLMLFLQLDLDTPLSLDPDAGSHRGRRLVRVIAGNPVTMGQMTRDVPDAGSYAPVTLLVEQTPAGGTRVGYDSVASALAPYGDAAASRVAEDLDAEVLTLLRQVTALLDRNV